MIQHSLARMGGGHGKVEVDRLSKGLSPIRQMGNVDKGKLPLVEGLGTQMEVTSPPKAAVPGSQCLPGRKKDLNYPAPVSNEPTGL